MLYNANRIVDGIKRRRRYDLKLVSSFNQVLVQFKDLDRAARELSRSELQAWANSVVQHHKSSREMERNISLVIV